MSDTEINIAIAEWCGWKKYPHHPLAYTHPTENRTELIGDMPSYTTDLNAMASAEERLNMGERSNFVDQLLAICCFRTALNARFADFIELTRATARQRAEALLRTLGKWKG